MSSSNIAEGIAGMSSRQKITIIVFVVVIGVIIWQMMSLFTGGSTPAPTVARQSGNKASGGSGPGMNQGPQSSIPQQADLPKPQGPQVDPQVSEMQQAAQRQYVDSINQLQMLKIARQIAETNQAIMVARLATITAQKNIVTMLSPPAVSQGTYAKGLVNPSASGQSGPNTSAPVTVAREVNYTVISVAKLQDVWAAVLGFQGNLYHVQVGDVLPIDQSTVVAIDNTGVQISKDGETRKISLVPII